MKNTLREKYRRFPVAQYRVIAKPGAKKGYKYICSLCAKEFTYPFAGADEVACSHCTMGLADAYKPEHVYDKEELIKAIRGRSLEAYRIKYNLTRGVLSRLIGISPRQYDRYEKGKYISILNLISKVENGVADVHSGYPTPNTPKK